MVVLAPLSWIQLRSWLKTWEPLRAVPVVLLTDKTLSNLDRAFEAQGVADVMLKPLTPADVLDAAKRAVVG